MKKLLGFTLAFYAAFGVADNSIEEILVHGKAKHTEHTLAAEPIHVISGDSLGRLNQNSLGELVSQTPGIKNSAYGTGVGRPVIRGMSNQRVKIMQNGLDSSDVSAMSSDHSPMSAFHNAESVEIIQGPKTLLYSGSALAGVINVRDQRIKERAESGFNADIILAEYGSNRHSFKQAATVQTGNEHWHISLDGFQQNNHDYRAHTAISKNQTIKNSDTESLGGGLGISFFPNADSYIGFALSQLRHDYAVPNDENEDLRVNPKQNHYELRAGQHHISKHIQAWHVALSLLEYQHEEKEDGIPEALFKKRSWQFKTHMDYAFNEQWQGAVGVQASYQRLLLCHDHDGCYRIPSYGESNSIGEHLHTEHSYDFSHGTPLPNTRNRQAGVFIVQEYQWRGGIVELGARIDHQQIQLKPSNIAPDSRQEKAYYRHKTFTPFNLSAASTWDVGQQQQIGLSLASKQRAPEAEEMFWNGAHHATFIYQLDNPNLKKEHALTSNVSWVWDADIYSRADVFYYDIHNFIFNQKQAFNDPFHGDEVYRYQQKSARLYGAEALISLPLEALTQGLALDIRADIVRAELKHGSHRSIPRTPPASLGLALHWQDEYWFSQIDVTAYARQNKTAKEESATAGYYQLNAQVSRRFKQLSLSLKANNLSNQQGMNHISYLKRQAPVMGRNFVATLKLRF